MVLARNLEWVAFMSEQRRLLTVCGGDCSRCANYLGQKLPHCAGCAAVEGKPFWAKGVCPVYACATGRGANHCGDCAKFPCDQFMSHYDPNNPEGQRNALFRAGVLAYRSKHGDKKTSLLVGKLGELEHT
jgi:hypothetical protein